VATTRSAPAESALEDALRLIGRRPRTRRELAAALAERGHDPQVVESACRRLLETGRLDDEALALHYILARSERLGHGPLRLVRELEARGLAPGLARRAWDQAVERGDLDPGALLTREVQRRVRGRTLRARDWRRVYNALLRAGFASEETRSALEPYRGADLAEADTPDGFHDDFA
jgi:regulatory protein